MSEPSRGATPTSMPTTSVGALTRTEGAPTGRSLSDMSDEERGALAAIVAQPRRRFADDVVALRGPLAIFATSVVAGIGGVWAALRFPPVNRVPIAPIAAIIAVGLCSGAFAFLLLSARRHGRLASVVAFLAERGFSPRSQQAAVIHLQTFERRLGVPPSAEDVLRFLKHLQKAQGGRADAVPLSVLDGIARALLTPPVRFLALLPSLLSAPSVVLKIAEHFSPLVAGAFAGTLLACLATLYVMARRPRRPSRQLLAPLELGLAAAEEDRLIRAFDAALQQTSRQRRTLAYELPVQLLVAQVKELLARDAVPDAVPDAVLDEARRRVFGEGEVASPAFSDTSSQPVVADVEVGARGQR